ncbi:uncharacterized protein [Pseudorca crassidens]|uniref:uncharacterized protein n=1 Tax=Pseudorca crassidens TaxID=82174 RepID=UPI00352EFCF5
MGISPCHPRSLEPVLSTPCLLFATMGLRFCPWPVPLGQASGSSAERGPAGILVRKGCWACRPREAEAATCSLEAPVYVFGQGCPLFTKHLLPSQAGRPSGREKSRSTLPVPPAAPPSWVQPSAFPCPSGRCSRSPQWCPGSLSQVPGSGVRSWRGAQGGCWQGWSQFPWRFLSHTCSAPSPALREATSAGPNSAELPPACPRALPLCLGERPARRPHPPGPALPGLRGLRSGWPGRSWALTPLVTPSWRVLSVDRFTIKKGKSFSPVARIPDTFDVLIIQDESAALPGRALGSLGCQPTAGGLQGELPLYLGRPQVDPILEIPSVHLICVTGG